MTRASHDDGPTIDDIAAAAGVSIRTVSRVLNASPKVGAQTRANVQAAIAALDYQPSPRARALAMGRSFLIALVHNDRNALVLDAVQRAIVDVAAAQGCELIVHPAPLDPETAQADIRAFLRRSRVDGAIVMPPVSGVPGLAGVFAASGTPAVAVSSVPVDGFDAALVSPEREAAGQVARHLIALGHRRLGLVNGPEGIASAEERRAGFLSAAAACKDVRVTQARGDYGFASGLAAAQALFADGAAAPSAIFAANDVMAAGVLKYAAREGIAVPDRLSVVGFDGSLLAQMVSPALASVVRRFDAIAAEAARLLFAAIAGEAPAAAQVPELVLENGESCGPAPQG